MPECVKRCLNRDKIPEYFIVIVTLGIGLFNLSYNKKITNPYAGMDFTTYRSIGESLLVKEGYKGIYQQYDWKFPAPYPPFYPFVLAFLMSISSDEKDFICKLLMFHLLVFCLTGIGVFLLCKEILGNKIFALLCFFCFITNHLTLYHFFLPQTEGPFLLCSILSIYYWYLYFYCEKPKSRIHFFLAVVLGCIASYIRVFGIVLLFSFLFSHLPFFKFSKEKMGILCSFVPIVSFYFYWWLFTGAPGQYFREGSILYTKDFIELKYTIAEFIFYIPFLIIFCCFGIDEMDFFFYPLIFIGRTTRLNLAGIVSLVVWCIAIMQCIKMVSCRKLLVPFLFLFGSLVHLQHTCSRGHGPRILLLFLPFFLCFLWLAIYNIKNRILRGLCSTIFIIIYCSINLYVVINPKGI